MCIECVFTVALGYIVSRTRRKIHSYYVVIAFDFTDDLNAVYLEIVIHVYTVGFVRRINLRRQLMGGCTLHIDACGCIGKRYAPYLPF